MASSNVYPGMTGDWVGVAFMAGSLNLHDELTMVATMGSKVHCELLVGKGQNALAYSSFSGLGGFVRSQSVHRAPQWTVLALPVTDAKAVLARALHLVSLQLPYNSGDLWQCCVKVMLPVESELDCQRPDTWRHGVFCSQACLLMLRRLAREGLVAPPAPLRHALEGVHSRGCSPNTLFGILTPACRRVF